MQTCNWCHKNKGAFESFTKHGYCESCEKQIRADITTLKQGMDILQSQAGRCTTISEKERILSQTEQLYNALKAYKDKAVPFFKSDIEAARLSIIHAIDATKLTDNASSNSNHQLSAETVQRYREKSQAAQLSYSSKQPPIESHAPTQAEIELAYMREDLLLKQQTLEMQQQQLDSLARCPRCGSTSLSANKKGFGIGKAVVGAVVAGPLGLAAGGVGANKVKATCLKCGHQFRP